MEATLHMNSNQHQETSTGVSNSKLLLYLGIGSIIMLFAGLTSAYIVRQAEGNWLVFELPTMFYYSTTVIILSSIVFQIAVNSAKKGNRAKTILGLWTALALGFVFIYFQYLGWTELYTKGVVFAGSEANASGSFMYAITGLHIAHLLGGILYLLLLNVSLLFKTEMAKVFEKAELCSIYWHFLGILWVYLLLFLIFIR